MKQDWIEQFKKEMQEHVSDTIRMTVNGKLDKISEKLEGHIKSVKDWQEQAQPAIDTFINLRGGYKSILIFSAFLVAIGAAVTVIKRAIGL